jgi:hypothetical protein
LGSPSAGAYFGDRRVHTPPHDWRTTSSVGNLLGCAKIDKVDKKIIPARLHTVLDATQERGEKRIGQVGQ